MATGRKSPARSCCGRRQLARPTSASFRVRCLIVTIGTKARKIVAKLLLREDQEGLSPRRKRILQEQQQTAPSNDQRPRPIRDRIPPPWRLEDVPGGFRVTDAHGRPLAYVYSVDGSARAALPDALTPAEARAIALTIARLPEIMPAP
jgi:hypothetical protein